VVFACEILNENLALTSSLQRGEMPWIFLVGEKMHVSCDIDIYDLI
jgi:hypothetical protein